MRGLFSQLDAHTLLTWPVSAIWARGIARISHPLDHASSRNGSCWFAVSDQAEKNRPVKNVLLEKKGDCMRDEYQILVHPVVSGSGKPLFKNIKDRVKGKAKQVEGAITGDRGEQAQGVLEETKGRAGRSGAAQSPSVWWRFR